MKPLILVVAIAAAAAVGWYLLSPSTPAQPAHLAGRTPAAAAGAMCLFDWDEPPLPGLPCPWGPGELPRPCEISMEHGPRWRLGYDEDGRLATIERGRSDGGGRARIDCVDWSPHPEGGQTVSFSKERDDRSWKVLRVADDGRLLERTEGNRTTTFTYDEGAEVNIEATGAGSFRALVDAGGLLRRVKQGNRLREAEYELDGAGQVVRESWRDGYGADLTRFEYEWEDARLVTVTKRRRDDRVVTVFRYECEAPLPTCTPSKPSKYGGKR